MKLKKIVNYALLILSGAGVLFSAFFIFVLIIAGGGLKEYWIIYLIFVIPGTLFLAMFFNLIKKIRIKNGDKKVQDVIDTNIQTPNNVDENTELKRAGNNTKYQEKEYLPINSKIMEFGNLNISDKVRNLLWMKGGRKSNYTPDLLNEPSLIDVGLELSNYNVDYNQDIGYYPSYRRLTPQQRYVYLSWLGDITRPIPIGYVFIFYYGLERHLLQGNLDDAFDMIVELRKYHNNASFLSYSADALLISAFYHKRFDLIEKINLDKATPVLSQFVIGILTGRIDAYSIVQNCKSVGFTNLRYIKSDKSLFISKLQELLIEKYGVDYYPITDEQFENCTKNFPLIIANYSLNINERIASAPDINTNKAYRKSALELLTKTHELIKIENRKNRSKTAKE